MPRENDVKIKIIFELKGKQALDQTKKALLNFSKQSVKSSQDTKKALKSITPAMQELWQQTERLAEHLKISFARALPIIKKLGKSFKFTALDTIQLVNAAETVEKKYKVSFKRAYDVLRKLGVGSKHTRAEVDKLAEEAVKFAKKWGISMRAAMQHQVRLSVEVKKRASDIKKSLNVIYHDTDRVLKVARKFAQAWGVPIADALKHVKKMGVGMTKTATTIEKDIKKIGAGMTKTAQIVEKSTKKMKTNITFLAWHFRYLGSIFDRIGQQMVRSIRNVIQVSAELEESFLSIRTAAVMYGQDVEGATALTRELALTGLMPLAEAANSVKNLMITGIGLPELEQFAYRYLDVAFLMTSGMDEMQKSLEVISKSMLRGTLVLSADVTARMLWTETEKRLQKTLGVSMKDLSARKKMMEILKTIEEEYAATLGFHRMEMETTRATMNRLNTAITLIKDSLGKALVPLVEAAAISMAKFATYITMIVDAMGPMIPILAAVGIAVAFFVSKVAWSIGILLSFIKIAGAASLALWKLYLPVIAVSAVVIGATYLWLKYSGALDKVKSSAAAIDNQLQQLQNTYKGLMDVGEDSIEIDEDRAIAHRRRVEDMEEDLERERSKGLWANQMTIKDLEKRLKREDEDWKRYVSGRGDISDAGNQGLLGNLGNMFNDMENATKKHVATITDLWNKLKDPQMWEGIRTAIQKFLGGSITDPEFWREFGKNFIENLGKTIIGIGDIITAMFEGLFGSVMKGVAVIAASTFVISFGKTMLALMPLKAATIGTATGLAFQAALPAAVSITLILLTSLAIKQALSFRETIQGMWSSAESGAHLANRAISGYIRLLNEGKIDAEEFKRLSDEAIANQRQVIELAEKSTGIRNFLRGIWEEPFWSLPNRQFGGIVPGPINKPIPIMAHGGERIVPSREPAEGGVTININNPIVREQQDIQKIADAVRGVLGQRNRFARLGAY